MVCEGEVFGLVWCCVVLCGVVVWCGVVWCGVMLWVEEKDFGMEELWKEEVEVVLGRERERAKGVFSFLLV